MLSAVIVLEKWKLTSYYKLGTINMRPKSKKIYVVVLLSPGTVLYFDFLLKLIILPIHLKSLYYPRKNSTREQYYQQPHNK